jgi:plasmid stability protein
MADLLIRNIDDATVARLKARAADNKRSLQAELQAILERAAVTIDLDKARKVAERIQRQLRGRQHPDSAALIREDRER